MEVLGCGKSCFTMGYTNLVVQAPLADRLGLVDLVWSLLSDKPTVWIMRDITDSGNNKVYPLYWQLKPRCEQLFTMPVALDLQFDC